ncbi:VWA domain-containing protein [bacterium CPR1]|nr:VWA domain-containing protein [bacterium CPR1]
MLKLIPDRNALATDQPCTVDLLIRIEPPSPVSQGRTLLNLALVLDRSGSMAGAKLELTRQAAALAVKSLSEDDRFSVVLFDDRVDTLVPSAPLKDKPRVLKLIEGLSTGGSTALFAGWQSGGDQALKGLEARRVNRVVLLTDGQANVGETNPDAICHAVHRLAEKGVQTTTIGFGRDYNETLLRSMASSGDGNHFFVEQPEQLPSCFEVELGGLVATLGRRVRLELKPLRSGVVVEPLAELEKHPDGGYKLADLVAGWPMEQVFRLTVPAQTGKKPPLEVVLTWEEVAESRARSLEVPLELPAMTFDERQALPLDRDVELQVGVAMAARARLEAMDVMRQGDRAAATRILRSALTSYKLPDMQRAELEDLARTTERGDTTSSLKKGTMQSYSYSRGSVTMSSMGGIIKLMKYLGSSIDLQRGPLFSELPSEGDRPWSRVAGMLTGLYHGERLGRPAGAVRGEASVLTAMTLATIGQDQLDDPSVMLGSMFEPQGLARVFVNAPVDGPGGGLKALRSTFDATRGVFYDARSAGCGALQRAAAFLVPHASCPMGKPMSALWVDVTFGTALTHNESAALAASLGWARILWELLASPAPPKASWYLDTFLDTLRGLEMDKEYVCRTGRLDGWKGKLSDFVREAVQQARAERQPAELALESWGQGAYLLEVMPGILYLLECLGDDPARALAAAPPGGWMGALVGAAVGALHGAQSDWQLEPDQADALEQARVRFGYAS